MLHNYVTFARLINMITTRFTVAGNKVIALPEQMNKFICFENEAALKMSHLQDIFAQGNYDMNTYDMGNNTSNVSDTIPSITRYMEPNEEEEEEMLYDLGDNSVSAKPAPAKVTPAPVRDIPLVPKRSPAPANVEDDVEEEVYDLGDSVSAHPVRPAANTNSGSDQSHVPRTPHAVVIVDDFEPEEDTSVHPGGTCSNRT
jgi:hypothetical protein